MQLIKIMQVEERMQNVPLGYFNCPLWAKEFSNCVINEYKLALIRLLITIGRVLEKKAPLLKALSFFQTDHGITFEL